jgi:hypothetical protein
MVVGFDGMGASWADWRWVLVVTVKFVEGWKPSMDEFAHLLELAVWEGLKVVAVGGPIDGVPYFRGPVLGFFDVFAECG